MFHCFTSRFTCLRRNKGCKSEGIIGFLHDQRIWCETTNHGWWIKSYTGKDSWPRVWYMYIYIYPRWCQSRIFRKIPQEQIHVISKALDRVGLDQPPVERHKVQLQRLWQWVGTFWSCNIPGLQIHHVDDCRFVFPVEIQVLLFFLKVYQSDLSDSPFGQSGQLMPILWVWDSGMKSYPAFYIFL